jgi:hypothetical protein
MSEEQGGLNGARSPSITFHYLKSPAFRSVHAAGAHGGPEPSGRGVVVSFFSERIPIPQQTTFQLNEDGSLGPEDLSRRVAKEGVIREVEATVHMDMETARDVHEWLGSLLSSLESTPPKRSQ